MIDFSGHQQRQQVPGYLCVDFVVVGSLLLTKITKAANGIQSLTINPYSRLNIGFMGGGGW